MKRPSGGLSANLDESSGDPGPAPTPAWSIVATPARPPAWSTPAVTPMAMPAVAPAPSAIVLLPRCARRAGGGTRDSATHPHGTQTNRTRDHHRSTDGLKNYHANPLSRLLSSTATSVRPD